MSEEEASPRNRWIAGGLTAGMAASLAIMLVGQLLGAAGEPVEAAESGVVETVKAASEMQPGGMMELGILVLLATPLVVVLITLTGFARERDWLFSGITTGVMALLVVSVMVGAG